MRNMVWGIAAAMMVLALAPACDVIEDAKDDATEFDEDAEIELSITETENTNDTEPYGLSCDVTTLNQALEDAGIDTGDVDIDSIDLQYVNAGYSNAEWDPAEAQVYACGFAMYTESGRSALIFEFDPERNSSLVEPINVSDAARETLDYILAHRDEQFYYCAGCAETGVDSYSVDYVVEVGVTVTGNVSD
jgi:hypothetical protein